MPEEWDEQLQMPQPAPQGDAEDEQDVEQLLRKKLVRYRDEYCQTLWKLAWLCSRSGRLRQAVAYIQEILAIADDPDIAATCYLTLGQFMEQVREYRAALAFYAQAYALEPVEPNTAYYVHNNLGYCLNRLERYEEAESYLRAAIEIDPKRQNAYKNLGVSLEKQGRCAEAAQCYIQGIEADASDARALWHLEELVSDHPEVAQAIPDLFLQLERCRAAVQAARAKS